MPAELETRAASPQAHNGNAIKWGLQVRAESQRVRFELGTLGRGLGRVERTACEWRAALERVVLDRHGGEVNFYRAAKINTACRWERHARLLERRMRLDQRGGEDNGGKLNHENWLKYQTAICNAAERRDAALEKLGLDQDDVDSLPAFESIDVTALDPAPATDAADGQPVAQEGQHEQAE